MALPLDIDAVIDEAERRCKERGTRLTSKRKQILSCLLKTNTALSAYELADLCKAEYGHAIPPMSVYRILDFLKSQNLVHRLNVANKYVACAHIAHDCEHAHDHGMPQFLICGNCHKVEEISVARSTINTLRRGVEDAGFQLVSPQLEMNCVCQDCLSEAAG